ncbi:MAG: transporter substrate-binding protein [Paracoccaceae bacterium]
MNGIKGMMLGGAMGMALAGAALAQEETIKVGVLHSLSGTMAISETTLKDTMLMLIAEQNAKGGLLGKQLEAVVVDPASDWPLFAEKARELLTVSNVDVMFGCWTSVSRKSVLPVIEELNGLLFYPVQYEGEESSKNVFYTGAAPNQQAIPATDFPRRTGGEAFALLGTTMSIRARRTTFESYLISKGIPKEDIFVNYTPFGHSDWSKIVADVVALGADGKKVGVISTINGDANIGFYKELAAAGVSADEIPVVASPSAKRNCRVWIRPTSPASGGVLLPVHATHRKRGLHRKMESLRRAWYQHPMEACHRLHVWVQAVEKAGTTDVDAVREAMYGLEVPNLTGGIAKMLPNHHLTKPVLIGEIRADGQFDIISQTEPVAGDAWTDFLPESAVLEADWAELDCGMYNTETKTCVQIKSNY